MNSFGFSDCRVWVLNLNLQYNGGSVPRGVSGPKEVGPHVEGRRGSRPGQMDIHGAEECGVDSLRLRTKTVLNSYTGTCSLN